MKETDWAWAAGLFEGEGCIIFKKRNDGQGYSRYLKLTSTDEDVVNDFADIVGCGKIVPVTKAQDHHKQAYMWSIAKFSDIKCVLEKFLPYLKERRLKKAQEMLAHPTGFHIGQKTHCKYGHELNKANSYLASTSTGKKYKVCRKCRAIQSNKRYHRNKEAGSLKKS